MNGNCTGWNLTRVLRISLALLCLAATSAVMNGQSAPSSQPSGPAYDFHVGYKPGQNLLLVSETSFNTQDSRPGGQPMSLQFLSEYPLSFQAADGTGDFKGKMTIRRILMSRKRGDSPAMERDSQRPETLGGPIEKTMPSIGGVIDIQLDGKGRLLSSQLDPATSERMQANVGATPSMLSTMANASAAMMLVPWSYRPDGAVRVGDTWKRRHETHLLDAAWRGQGPLPEEDAQCRLVDVKETSAGRIANIEIKGKVLVPEQMPGLAREMNLTGAVAYNLRSGLLTEFNLQADGEIKEGEKTHITFTISLTDAANPASSPASMPSRTTSVPAAANLSRP